MGVACVRSVTRERRFGFIIGCRSFGVFPTKWLSMRTLFRIFAVRRLTRGFSVGNIFALWGRLVHWAIVESCRSNELLFSAIRHNQTAIRQLLTLHQLQINLAGHFIEQRNAGTEQHGMDVESDLIDQPRFE